MEYHATFEPAAEGGFVVEFPDFGWGVTQGDTEDDACARAHQLLLTLIQDHIRRGEPLPRPGKARARNRHPIRLSALQSLKVELYLAFLASGLRKSELARRLDIPKTIVDRLFDLSRNTRLDQLESAFAALGRNVDIQIRGAA